MIEFFLPKELNDQEDCINAFWEQIHEICSQDEINTFNEIINKEINNNEGHWIT